MHNVTLGKGGPGLQTAHRKGGERYPVLEITLHSPRITQGAQAAAIEGRREDNLEGTRVGIPATPSLSTRGH